MKIENRQRGNESLTRADIVVFAGLLTFGFSVSCGGKAVVDTNDASDGGARSDSSIFRVDSAGVDSWAAGADSAVRPDVATGVDGSTGADLVRPDHVTSDGASGLDAGVAHDNAVPDRFVAVDGAQPDGAVTPECVVDGDCGDADCIGGICRDKCLFSTCYLADTGDHCVDGYCVDCETSDDCSGNQSACDLESYACIELGFRPDPIELNCGACPSGTLCGGGGDPTQCGTPGFGASWCTPSTSVPSNWSYLENGYVRVGADMSRGGAIGHFSSLTSNGNVLDENDTGRFLQQSYYGDNRGGSWNGQPWHYNPVQGGDSSDVPSEVTEYCNNGSTLYAKTIPLDWGGLGVTHTVMEEWITLAGDIAVIRFRFEYLEDWNNAARHQEVPAFFVHREFEHLTFYQGGSTWTGSLSSILPNQQETQGNQYINFNEPWLAYMNASGWGVGIYSRSADNATCYRYQNIGDGSATSYFAILDTFALNTGTVHDYTIYMQIGSAENLRAKFRQLYQAGL